MKFKVIDKGKTYSLPLEGMVISGIDMRHFLGLELQTSNSSLPGFVININMGFELTRFNQSRQLNPGEITTIKTMLDLVGLKIKKSTCSKTGDLYLLLDDGTEINVSDSEYESWHINSIKQERITNSWVIGGVGTIAIFELND